MTLFRHFVEHSFELSKHFVGVSLESGPSDKVYDKVADKGGVAHRVLGQALSILSIFNATIRLEPLALEIGKRILLQKFPRRRRTSICGATCE